MQPIATKIKDFLESIGFNRKKTEITISYDQNEDGTVNISENGYISATITIRGLFKYE